MFSIKEKNKCYVVNEHIYLYVIDKNDGVMTYSSFTGLENKEAFLCYSRSDTSNDYEMMHYEEISYEDFIITLFKRIDDIDNTIDNLIRNSNLIINKDNNTILTKTLEDYALPVVIDGNDFIRVMWLHSNVITDTNYVKSCEKIMDYDVAKKMIDDVFYKIKKELLSLKK